MVNAGALALKCCGNARAAIGGVVGIDLIDASAQPRCLRVLLGGSIIEGRAPYIGKLALAKDA
jgi:hypothetical protein